MVYALIIRAAKVKSRHCIIRQTFSAIKRSIFLDTFPKVMRICFPNLSFTSNKSDYYVTLPNGSEIWFCGLDNSRAEKILGMEFATIYFNEASEMDYSPIQIVVSRLAQKTSLINRVWMDFNPPVKSHWSYWLFIKKLDPIDEESLKEPEMYGHFLMNPKDNLENIDEEYLKLLERMPEKDRERFLEGKFGDVDEGAVYYSFDRERHVREVKRIGGSVLVFMDFNVDPGTAVICQFYNDKFHIVDEVFLPNSDTYKMCDQLIRKNYIGPVYPDSTGSNRKTSGISDFEILRSKGFTIEKTRNAFVVDRINNVNRLLQENRIIIDPKCRKLINDLEKVSWKDNKLDQTTNKYLTHISDALGYGTWKLAPLRTEKKSTVHRY